MNTKQTQPPEGLAPASGSAVQCDECSGTGICGDEGPGLRNAHYEWVPCDCPLGDKYRDLPAPEIALRKRVEVLEDALNEIYHQTSSTTGQMEIIERVLPQKPIVIGAEARERRHAGEHTEDDEEIYPGREPAV